MVPLAGQTPQLCRGEGFASGLRRSAPLLPANCREDCCCQITRRGRPGSTARHSRQNRNRGQRAYMQSYDSIHHVLPAVAPAWQCCKQFGIRSAGNVGRVRMIASSNPSIKLHQSYEYAGIICIDRGVAKLLGLAHENLFFEFWGFAKCPMIPVFPNVLNNMVAVSGRSADHSLPCLSLLLPTPPPAPPCGTSPTTHGQP